MRLSLSFILSLVPISIFGQLGYPNLSAEGNGQAGISSIIEGASAVFANPSGVASTEDFAIYLVSQNIAGLEGLETSGIGLIIPSSIGTLGLSGIYYWDNLFNSRKVSFGWAQRMGIAQLGIQAGWESDYVQGGGMSNSLLIDFSGIVELAPFLKIGAGIFNLLASKYFQEERIPVIARAAIDYHPLPSFHLSGEIEKNLDEITNYKVGISYLLRKHLYFSTGIHLNPVSHSFGFGIILRKFIIHSALVNLPGFGTIQSISLSIIPGKDQDE